MNLASILQQPFGQYKHCIRYGRTDFAITQTFITIQHKCTLLVGIYNLLSEISTLDGWRQINFTSSQPSQHDCGYTEVDRVADVTVSEVYRATTIQQEHLTFITGRQLGGQPLAINTNVGQQWRIVFGWHLKTWRSTHCKTTYLHTHRYEYTKRTANNHETLVVTEPRPRTIFQQTITRILDNQTRPLTSLRTNGKLKCQ